MEKQGRQLQTHFNIINIHKNFRNSTKNQTYKHLKQTKNITENHGMVA